MDPRQPPWEVLIDDQDRVVPFDTAPSDGPVTWASGPMSSAVARYRVILRADGSLDLAAVEYFDDYQPQEIRPAELWADQDERIHASAGSATAAQDPIQGRPEVPDVPDVSEEPEAVPVVAQDQDIPVVIPVLVGHPPGTTGVAPARDTFENRLHAVDLPSPLHPAATDTTSAPTTPTGDQPLIWEYQTGESASDARRRRYRRTPSSPGAAAPAPAPAPGGSSADSRRQRALPKQAPAPAPGTQS